MQLNETCESRLGKLTVEEKLVYQFRAYITPFIILFGLLGNIIVLIIFCLLHKRVPCRFNLYILGITIAHSLELLINAFLDDFLGRGLMWLSDCSLFVKLDIQSNFSCRLITYLVVVTPMIATSVLALFSCDRVVTIYQPIKYRGDRYLYVSITGIVMIYLISFSVFIPSLVHTGLIQSDKHPKLHMTNCRYLNPLHIAVQFSLYMSNIGSTLIPFTIVLITTLLIVIKLKRLFAERARMGGNEERGLSELRRVIGHLAMTTTFFIINLPLLVVVIMRQHADYHNYKQLYPDYDFQMKNLSRLFSSFKSLNHALEFPTFFIFLPSFRVELCKLVKRWWPMNKPMTSQTDSGHNSSQNSRHNSKNLNLDSRKCSRPCEMNRLMSLNSESKLLNSKQPMHRDSEQKCDPSSPTVPICDEIPLIRD